MVLFLGGKKEEGFPQRILLFIQSTFFRNPGFLKLFSSTALHYDTLNQKPRGTHMSA